MMTNHEHQQPGNMEQKRDDTQSPYWRRAHHEWWFLALMVLILAGMAAYVLNLDLSMMPSREVFPLLDLAEK